MQVSTITPATESSSDLPCMLVATHRLLAAMKRGEPIESLAEAYSNYLAAGWFPRTKEGVQCAWEPPPNIEYILAKSVRGADRTFEHLVSMEEARRGDRHTWAERDKDHNTLLHAACRQGDLLKVCILLSSSLPAFEATGPSEGGAIRMKTQNKAGLDPMLEACAALLRLSAGGDEGARQRRKDVIKHLAQYCPSASLTSSPLSLSPAFLASSCSSSSSSFSSASSPPCSSPSSSSCPSSPSPSSASSFFPFSAYCCNVNLSTPTGQTPLWYVACASRDLHLTKLLLALGADPTQGGILPFLTSQAVREAVMKSREGGKAGMAHAFKPGFVRLLREDASGWRVYRLKKARMINDLRATLAVTVEGEGGRVGGTGCLQLRRWRREGEEREGGGEMPWVRLGASKEEGQEKKKKRTEEEVEVEKAGKEEDKEEEEEEEEEKKETNKKEGERNKRKKEKKEERVQAVARHVLEGGLKADLFVELCEYFNGQWPTDNGRSRTKEGGKEGEGVKM